MISSARFSFFLLSLNTWSRLSMKLSQDLLAASMPGKRSPIFTVNSCTDEMKLLAHNFLTSNFLKGVSNGYPLLLTVTRKEVKKQEFSDEFVKRIIPKIDYFALRSAAASVDEAEGLPEAMPDKWDEDQTLLRKLHHVMVAVEVIEGEMKCPESGRVFPIKDGIPNMLANESEIKCT